LRFSKRLGLAGNPTILGALVCNIVVTEVVTVLSNLV
jgi:hypothetical protein